MSEQVTFPLRINRGGKFFGGTIIFMTFFSAIFAIILFYVLSIDPKNHDMALILPIATFILTLITNYIILKASRPAIIEIAPPTIKITPVPFLGKNFCTAATYNVGDLSSLELDVLKARGTSYLAVLRDKNNKEAITFFVAKPTTPTAEDFVRQIGTALNLQVKINA